MTDQAPESDAASTPPMFRTFRLACDEAEINAIGIGLELLAELSVPAQLRVTDYWASKARSEAERQLSPSSQPME